MLKNIKVEIPKKGCIVNTHNKMKIPYVYYATNYYRDDFGRPRTTRILIGKKDLETNLLIPNDNFFDLFNVEIIVKEKDGNNNNE